MKNWGSSPRPRGPGRAALTWLFVLSLSLVPAMANAAAPVVDSFTSSAPWVTPGGAVTLSLQAHDPDCVSPPCTTGCGAYLRADQTAWSATGGTLGGIDNGASASPYAATAAWQAPSVEGSYTITVSLYDSGTFMCGGQGTATAQVSVAVSTTPPPTIEAFTVSPSLLPVGGTALLSVSATDPLGRALTYGFSAPAGTIQHAGPASPEALFTAPPVGGPLVLTCTVTPAGGMAATQQATAQVAIGEFLGWLPGTGDFATKVVALPSGEMAVLDSLHGTVQVRSVDGAYGWRATGLAEPVAAATLGTELYVLERGAAAITVFDTSGTRVRSLPLAAGRATDAAAGPSAGEISVADAATARVLVLSAANGSVLRTVGDGLLVAPSAVAAEAGRLAVTDTNLRRIVLFDGPGNVMGTLLLDDVFVRPQGVVWNGADDQVVTADVFTGELTVLSSAGALKGQMGGWVTGDHQLGNPTGLARVAGNVLAVPVASTGRVALYRLYPAAALPTAAISAAAGVCAGSPGNLASVPDAGPSATYAWTIANGFVTSGDGTRQVAWTAGGEGTVALGVTVTVPGGSSTASRSVLSTAPPAAPWAVSNSPVCAGSPLKLTAEEIKGAGYSWTGPNGFTSSLRDPVIPGATPAEAGAYVVSVTVNGCPTPPTATQVSVMEAPALPTITAPAGVSAGSVGNVASVFTEPGNPFDLLDWSVVNGKVTSGQGTSRITFTAGVAGALTIEVVARGIRGCASPTAATTLAVSKIRTEVSLAGSVDVASPAVGEDVRLRITASNGGPDGATGVEVTDLLPAGLTFVSASPSTGTYDPGSGLWAVGSLAAGGIARLDVVATVNAQGTIVNKAARTAGGEPDSDPSNNAASVGVNAPPAADVQLHMDVDDVVPPVGRDVTITLTVRNAGPSSATGLVVTDLVPPGLAIVSAAPSAGSWDGAALEWTIGDLPANGAVSLRVVANVGQEGPLANVAAKVQAEPDPESSNDSASVTLNAVDEADLAIGIAVSPEPAPAGEAVSWTLTVMNLGPGAATNATATQTLPAGLVSVTAVPSQGSCSGGATLTCTLGTLPAGGTATVRVAATKTVTGPLASTAVVSADQPDPFLTNNSTTATSTPVGLLGFEAE